MKTHIALDHEEKKALKCDVCDYFCSRKQQMKQHVANKHRGKKL